MLAPFETSMRALRSWFRCAPMRFWSRSFPQIAEVNSFAMCAIAVLARCLKIDAEKTRVLWLDRDAEQLALRGRGVRDCWIRSEERRVGKECRHRVQPYE